MAARPSDFPDSLVGLGPCCFQEREQSLLQRPRIVVGRDAGSSSEMQRVHHLSVHVELQLTDGGVSYPHGPRLLIARQPWQFELGQPPLTVYPVHDVQL